LVMTIALLGLKVNVRCQGKTSKVEMDETRSVGPRSWIKDIFLVS